ncbi:hypothetical protein JCM8097_008930 [Rhodosporidiobolus ruineniae]
MELGKSALRSTKNLWSYSGVESRVRDATSNSEHGPSIVQMQEIAEWSFNQQDCTEIVTMLDRRLNDKGKNWRHVYKSLVLIDYLLRNGSMAIVRYFTQNLYVIKTLKEFQHLDDNGTDVGLNVRDKAVQISRLLLDEDRLRRERGNGGKTRYDPKDLNRHLAGPSSSPRASVDGGVGRRRSMSQPLPTSSGDTRRLRVAAREREQMELGEAMRASKEDEERRQGLLRAQAGDALFDDLAKKEDPNTLIDLPPSTGPAPPDPMQQLYEEQRRQAAMQQAQQDALAQQMFALQLQQQQQQQQAQQDQANAAAYAAYQQQAAYEQLQAQAQAQYAAQLQAQQQQQYYAGPTPQPAMQVQPTGVNNPFAAFSPAAPSAAFTPSPSLSASQPSSFSPSSYTPPTQLSPSQSSSFLSLPSATPMGRPRASTTSAVEGHAHGDLERLIGTGTGVDTFGNVGGLRVPSGPHFSSFPNR